MPSRFPAGKLLAFGTGASVVAVWQTFLGPGILAALAGLGGGLLKTLFAGEVRGLLNGGSPGPSSLIQNHDLRQLVGEAIADTMRLQAGSGPHEAEAAPIIDRLANGAAELWSSAATAGDADYTDFDEKSVSDLFASDATNFDKVTVLDEPTWRGFLNSLNDSTEADAESKLLDSLAKGLHQRLPEMVRVKVKQDFSGETTAQGRGFASLHLILMGRLVANVEQLLNRSSGGDTSAEMLAELKTLNEKIPAAVDKQYRRVNDPEERAALSSTLAEIKRLGPRIEGRLNDLAKAVQLADEGSRERDAKTHEGIAAIAARLEELLAPKEIGEDPTKKKLPPEVLDAARELLERGDQQQQALAKIALGEHEEADRIIQELKREPLVEVFRLLMLEGNNWYNAGEFDRAVEPYEQALALKPDDVNALHNAAIAHNRARLGSIADHQLRAIKLLEKAADKTRTSDRWFWATTQNNLGNAYAALPTGDQSENFAQAIHAYELALEVYTREAHSAGWATAQNNLGAAYWALPTGDQSENLAQAIRAYESALEVHTREAHPVDWAGTQNNLGVVYQNLTTGDLTENLTRAIRAYELALEVYTRKAYPVNWATTQINLGRAYALLPTGDRDKNFARAIRAYELALEVRTRQAHPADWATTQINLGSAYAQLPTGDLAENLARAIRAYELTLEVRTRQAHPVDWALTQNNLGNVYRELPTGDRAEHLARAIRAYELALEVYSREAHPARWAMTQYNLAICLADMASVDLENKCDWLEKVIASGKAALTVYSAEAFPREHANTSPHNLQIIREAYEAARCADQRPFDEIAPAE